MRYKALHTGTRSSTNAMDVVVRILWQIIIDDKSSMRDIEASVVHISMLETGE